MRHMQRLFPDRPLGQARVKRQAGSVTSAGIGIVHGSRRDALLYSLQANSKHGLTRSQSDFTRAYEIAVRNELVAPDDHEAVAALLGCSVSRAYDLTVAARAEAKAERDAAIQAGIEAGKS